MKSQKPKKEFSEQELKSRKEYKIELLISLISALVIEIYFIVLNALSEMQAFGIYVKSSYIVLILIAILIFEIAYRKEKKNLGIIGIELVILAVHTLLISKSINTVNITKEHGILTTSYIWLIYHGLKAIIIYTKENRRRLKQISDIAEIVKEEKPTKKVAKKRKT